MTKTGRLERDSTPWVTDPWIIFFKRLLPPEPMLIASTPRRSAA